jgi:bifunctional non-homologous end joining protein LigD
MTATYPELVEVADWLRGHSAVLDGEIVALEESGRSDFSLLQQRMKLARPGDIARGVAETPVKYFVFDLLWLDGVSLLGKKFDDRRRILEALGDGFGHVDIPEVLTGTVDEALAMTREKRWEGIIAKAGDSIYQPGKRARTWIKMKNFQDQEVVVVGWRPGNGRRAGSIGSLLLAIPEKDGLHYVGRVGTGFTDAALDDVEKKLKPLARRTTPVIGPMPRMETRDARWVEPDLVGEVTFSEWSRDGVLRQSSWRGWRPDKDPSDVRRAAIPGSA